MDNRSGKTSVPLSSLEEEVEAEANLRTIEVLIRLLEKLDNISTLDPGELLRIYVALKRTKHRLKKHFIRDWIFPKYTWEEYCNQIEKLNLRISEARRNYYAAKQCIDRAS